MTRIRKHEHKEQEGRTKIKTSRKEQELHEQVEQEGWNCTHANTTRTYTEYVCTGNTRIHGTRRSTRRRAVTQRVYCGENMSNYLLNIHFTQVLLQVLLE